MICYHYPSIDSIDSFLNSIHTYMLGFQIGYQNSIPHMLIDISLAVKHLSFFSLF